MRRARSQSGFSVLDLMIAVTIAGILSTIGLQQFKSYKSKAKRPEAMMVFRAVADAQDAHRIATGSYATTFEELGFSLAGGSRPYGSTLKGAYYTFTLSQPFGPDTWYCVASGNLDGDPWVDVLAASSVQ